MVRRPTVSNRWPSSSGPSRFPKANGIALGVALEGGVGDHPEADAAALADLDRALHLLQPLAGLLLDLPFDVVDQLLGRREQLLVQQQQRQGGPEHGPEPERAVDDQVDPAPVKNRQA
jgi:hypothetical protein